MPAVASWRAELEHYLAVESIFYVELSRAVYQTPRISFVEARDLNDAMAYAADLTRQREGTRVVEVRRAVPADAPALKATE